ncbi:MAG: bile acid:sodium symporter family protein [Sphingobium sp.]|nr:bile acid:sodium symporter family protein [Sphingobium sp.]
MRPPFSISSIDPFLLFLMATVAVASLLPVHGAAAIWFSVIADLAIALLFFLHGAKLSRDAIIQGIGNWRLHLLVFGSTYLLFPTIGLASVELAGGWIDPLLLSGLLYLTLLPSTVQSSIAFTAIAGGNVAAAVCSASLSNLIGIILTPLLVSQMMRVDGSGAQMSWHSIESIVLQLLLPFLAGHLLRPLIGGLVARNKSILQVVDRGSILLVVYSAFSAAVVNGIWNILGWRDMLALGALSVAILAMVMGVNVLAATLLRLPREDAIVLLFCGSKKSLVSGVPMAGALFAPASVGMIVLPLMIFHQLQLFVCAALAARFRRQIEAAEVEKSQRPALPRTEADAVARAAELGMTIPAACMPGVLANLALLDRHAERLFVQDDTACA